MKNIAAGLLMCRVEKNELQFFLVHPGGPFFRKKNEGVWSIPKGIPEGDEGDEQLMNTALREFFEETGITPSPPYHSLGNIKQKSGKMVHAWTFMGAWDPSAGIVSNMCQVEWPPASKKMIDIPEVDRADWVNLTTARQLINSAQIPFLLRAVEIYAAPKSI
jgi:predicted NUDIX family NTP pyrophosphohydrolase